MIYYKIKNSKYLRTVTCQELKDLLDNNYIISLLPKRDRIRIFETMPINLISKYRYDVFIKYYYVQDYITNEKYDLTKDEVLKKVCNLLNLRSKGMEREYD